MMAVHEYLHGTQWQLDADPKKSAKRLQAELGITADSLRPTALRRIHQGQWKQNLDRHLLEIAMLPKAILDLARQDPEATYVLEQRKSPWGPSFRRLYVATSLMKATRRRGLGAEVVQVDAAHLKGPLGGFLWVAAEVSGNGHLDLLAFGISCGETAEDFQWFVALLRNDFPSIDTIMTDQGKAMVNYAAIPVLRGFNEAMQDVASSSGTKLVERVVHSLCVRHYLPHAITRHKNKHKRVEVAVWHLARSRTKAAVNRALQEARQVSIAFYDELLHYAPYISLCARIDVGLAPRSVLVSSGAECFFSVFRDARELGLISLSGKIIDWTNEKITIAANEALNLQAQGQLLTPLAHHLLDKSRDRSTKCQVKQCLVQHGPEVQVHGLVITNNREYKVVISQGRVDCTCRYWEDMGVPCRHAIRLLMEKIDGNRLPFSAADTHLYHPRYSIATQVLRYRNDIPHPTLENPCGDPEQHLPSLLVDAWRMKGLCSLPLYPGEVQRKARGRKKRKKNKDKKRFVSNFELHSRPEPAFILTDSEDEAYWTPRVALPTSGEEEQEDIHGDEEEEDLPDEEEQKEDSSSKRKCGLCGATGHSAVRCENGNPTYLLQKRKLLPGQMVLSPGGKLEPNKDIAETPDFGDKPEIRVMIGAALLKAAMARRSEPVTLPTWSAEEGKEQPPQVTILPMLEHKEVKSAQKVLEKAAKKAQKMEIKREKELQKKAVEARLEEELEEECRRIVKQSPGSSVAQITNAVQKSLEHVKPKKKAIKLIVERIATFNFEKRSWLLRGPVGTPYLGPAPMECDDVSLSATPFIDLTVPDADSALDAPKKTEPSNRSELTQAEIQKYVVNEKGWLSDRHIAAAVDLLKLKAPPTWYLVEPLRFVVLTNVEDNAMAWNRFATDTEKKTTVLFPVNVNGNHWVLLEILLGTHSIHVYDSLNSTMLHQIRGTFLERLSFIFGTKKRDWSLKQIQCGKQQDSSACGIFVIHHMKLLVSSAKITRHTVPMENDYQWKKKTQLMREQVGRELLSGQLEDNIVLANASYPKW